MEGLVDFRILRQGDPRVSEFYEKELVDKKLWPFGEDLRKRYDQTKQVLLKVQNHGGLLGSPESSLLQQKLRLRGPYITPLNVLQVSAPLHSCLLNKIAYGPRPAARQQHDAADDPQQLSCLDWFIICFRSLKAHLPLIGNHTFCLNAESTASIMLWAHAYLDQMQESSRASLQLSIISLTVKKID